MPTAWPRATVWPSLILKCFEELFFFVLGDETFSNERATKF